MRELSERGRRKSDSETVENTWIFLTDRVKFTFRICYFNPMPELHEIQIIGIIRQGTISDQGTEERSATSDLESYFVFFN